MSFFGSLDLAATGLTAERLRMDVTAENLANAQTPGYRRQDVALTQASGGGGFGATLAGALGVSGVDGSGSPGGVQVSGIVSDPTPDRLVYDPTNPSANAQGYVSMPNVNTVTEMVDLIDESRSYEANVTAMQTAKQMYTKTLDLLK
jgi:flagellar basal-body rod protein FlgC